MNKLRLDRIEVIDIILQLTTEESERYDVYVKNC